ncbi:hypothetical protein HDU98_010612 [Podochytrium sp. JEL0797]|nr:hypothetical protein HDU98_010612 [Podochytrium sp. JEL0797]
MRSATHSSHSGSVVQELAHCTFLLSSISTKISSLTQHKTSLGRWLQRAQLLASTLETSLQSNLSAPTPMQESVASLLALAKRVEAFVTRQASAKFMRSFMNRETALARISVFHQELASIANCLALAVQVNNQAWAGEERQDLRLDMEDLDRTLQHLLENEYKILNALELKQVEYLEAVEALQKNLTDHVDKALERSLDRLFMERALTCLRRATSETSPLTPANTSPPALWVLTSWEIDIDEHPIAQGGFAEVLKATWLNHTPVAVKRLHMKLETSRMRQDFLREVKVWFPLRHPNVLPLLGACATAERPFMVMPFMSRGHSLQYLDSVGGDLVEEKGIQLLYEVSLGMQYLHSRGYVHGDLKAVNVLVDEHGTAHVSDFGFASLKQQSSTRQTNANFGGTLRWMSPERLQGARLSPPVDVYAFAMMCFEILSEGDVPMTEVPDSLVFQHVVHSNLRPSLPEPSSSTTYQKTSKKLFGLMQACWDPNPIARPSFSGIAISMRSLADEAKGKGKVKGRSVVPFSEESGTSLSFYPSLSSSDELFLEIENMRNGDVHVAAGGRFESLGIPASPWRIGGGMLSRAETSPIEPHQQQQPIGREDFANLTFEEGTWGSLINDILPMFPSPQQHRIQTDMLLFGRELILPLSNLYRTPQNAEFCDFLSNIKLAANHEVNTIRFSSFMSSPSRTREEQSQKARIHLGLSRLGEGSRVLKCSSDDELKRCAGKGVFGGLWNTFVDLYQTPITMARPGVSLRTRNSDATVVNAGGGETMSWRSNGSGGVDTGKGGDAGDSIL